MSEPMIEHVNITVPDADSAADLMATLFGWRIRWSGDATRGGRSVHVGSESSYVAFYEALGAKTGQDDSYRTFGGLNHIGVVVDDLDEVEQRVKEIGLVPTNHGDYEPGRRFYFDTPEGIEIEVVSYTV